MSTNRYSRTWLGKKQKQSKIVAKYMADSLKVFINKHYHRGSMSWFFMRTMLCIKRKSWRVK
jgi:hypothetical protein